MARRADELQRWLERPLLWREPCHDAVMRMGADGAGAALDAEGDRRFDAKVARARETVRASGVEQALYEGLLEALGYGGNAPQMLALARLLPWARLRDIARRRSTARMEALLLGCAGLLPSQRGASRAGRAACRAMERVFARVAAAVVAAGRVEALGRAAGERARTAHRRGGGAARAARRAVGAARHR